MAFTGIASKLGPAAASIFSTMSALAQQHQAINLSQGFPDYPVDPVLIDYVHEAMQQGHNQYAPMAGLPVLRQSIAAKIQRWLHVSVDPDQEITVTPGATAALHAALGACIQAGDEVVVFEPAYDSYIPAIRAYGGIPVVIPLRAPEFGLDPEELTAHLGPKTRLLILNNPHNPTATVLSREDLDRVAEILRDTSIVLLSDEVYEHLVYDGQAHCSVLNQPELRSRSIAVFSFGKVFHATGWKMGYAVAPPSLMIPFRQVYQFMCFSAHTPTQHALARYLDVPEHVESLPHFFQAKRDFFLHRMQQSRFRCLPSRGTYFMLADYGAISLEPDTAFVQKLVVQHGVAAIPLSPFYSHPPQQTLIRFCFAKQESTLQMAAQRLQHI